MAGEVFCRLVFSKFFVFIFGKGSVLTITCLAVERWFSLIKPWEYKANFNRHKTYRYFVFIWVTSLVTQIYKLFYVRFSKYNCFFIPLSTILMDKRIETALIVAYVSLTFFCPTFLTWAAFIHIYFRISKSNALKESRGRRGRRVLLRMCAITSIMLTVCWFPTEVCYIINQYGFPILDFGTPFREFTVSLALANSFMNPWIYVVSNKRYRRILLTFLRAVCIFST